MTGLEALEKLDETLCDIEIKHKENLGYTKPLTRTIEKSLKALEIIKEKPQAGLSLIQLGQIKTYEEYLHYTSEWELDLYGDMVYTEEEFKLLKEMLE